MEKLRRPDSEVPKKDQAKSAFIWPARIKALMFVDKAKDVSQDRIEQMEGYGPCLHFVTTRKRSNCRTVMYTVQKTGVEEWMRQTDLRKLWVSIMPVFNKHETKRIPEN